jgi:hypothetical protein
MLFAKADDLEIVDEEDEEDHPLKEYMPKKPKYTKSPAKLVPYDKYGIVELNDNNFEHLTQASTGQTTGSWLLYFYSENDKSKMTGKMPAASILQEEYHTTVAVLNVLTKEKKKKASNTFRRFEMKRIPAFVYLHKGKIYDVPKTVGYGYDWNDIIKFIQNPDPAKSRNVPPVQTIWSIVTEEISKNKSEAVLVFFVILVAMSIAFAAIYWITTKLIPLDEEVKQKKRN